MSSQNNNPLAVEATQLLHRMEALKLQSNLAYPLLIQVSTNSSELELALQLKLVKTCTNILELSSQAVVEGRLNNYLIRLFEKKFNFDNISSISLQKYWNQFRVNLSSKQLPKIVKPEFISAMHDIFSEITPQNIKNFFNINTVYTFVSEIKNKSNKLLDNDPLAVQSISTITNQFQKYIKLRYISNMLGVSFT